MARQSDRCGPDDALWICVRCLLIGGHSHTARLFGAIFCKEPSCRREN